MTNPKHAPETAEPPAMTDYKRLEALTFCGCGDQFTEDDPGTCGNCVASTPPPEQASTGLVITLCGSARFERLFKVWNEALTMAGHTVFTLTAFPSDKGAKVWYTPEQKVALDGAHFRKIEASDAIFVLNRHAYIGESTMREIQHAQKLGKRVYPLESWGKGLGIGGSHTDEAQAAKLADGIPAGYVSPISTTTREGFLCPWSSDLMGPAGVLRSSLVTLVREQASTPRAEPAEYHDAALILANAADLTTTFCHECGHVGPVRPPALACCPDSRPRPVRAETAFYARAGFLASIDWNRDAALLDDFRKRFPADELVRAEAVHDWLTDSLTPKKGTR